jgi:tetrahydromethanopterin S-methyltransferase subunit G
MDDEIELISDGDGLAVIGNPSAIERFLDSLGLLSVSQDLGLHRLGSVLRSGEAAAEAAFEIAANSGRWLKLTPESAQRVKEFGLMETKTSGVSHAMLGDPGAIKSWLQIDMRPGSLLTNPAILAGAAGLMSQLASQHEMNEIKDYLAKIDKKVDEMLRNQSYAEWAKSGGAASVIQDAMTMREIKGRVDEISWSKVQGTPETIAATQRYVLLRLGGLAETLESTTKIGDLAKGAKRAESEAQELLAVLAHCFELQDAIDVLEIDRVLDATPDDVDVHRLGLKVARDNRREEILSVTESLIARMDVAAANANWDVLLHLHSHRTVVSAINHVGVSVDDFHKPLGIESGRASVAATRWRDAVRDPKQLSNAGAEVGRKALVVVGVVAATVLTAGLAKNASKTND